MSWLQGDWLKRLMSRIFPPLHGFGFWIACIVVLLLCAGLFMVLRTLPPRARRAVIVVVTFVSGLFYAVEFFLPATKDQENVLTFAVPTFGNILNILQGFALGLGVISLFRIHGKNVVRQRPGWGNSAVLLVSIIVMAVAAIGFEKPEANPIGRLFFRWLSYDVYA